jgi:nucleotide-binding universal stress UspA family protein
MSLLCATDFSSAAQAAADVAVLLAKKMNLKLHLVHCVHDYILMGDLPTAIPDHGPHVEQLKAEADRLRTTGVAVVEDFRTDGPEWGILTAAREQPTELIVLGSTGKGRAERWLVGSITENVAENAPVPTLVVREAEALLAWLRDGATLNLLCGVDMAGSSDAAVAWVRRLAEAGPVKVGASSVQTVNEADVSTEQHAARERDVWDKVHAALGDLPLTVHVREIFSQPVQEFLRISHEQQSALLVLGTHQRHGLQRLLKSSFSRRVLSHATTNVLCAPVVRSSVDSIPSIHRVLLATELGELTVDELRHAHSLLPGGGQIRLLHVCLEPSRGINPVIASEVYFDHSVATAKAREEAELKLKDLPSALLNVSGVKITTEVLTHHDIAAAVCDATERFGADVICMGTKGHSRTGIALLGSTVQAVLARAHKPVFVVTPPPS